MSAYRWVLIPPFETRFLPSGRRWLFARIEAPGAANDECAR